MILTMLFIGTVILFEAWPVYKIIMAQAVGSRISVLGWISIASSFVFVFAVNIMALFLPLKVGVNRLLNHEV
jgi:hypothetical protein